MFQSRDISGWSVRILDFFSLWISSFLPVFDFSISDAGQGSWQREGIFVRIITGRSYFFFLLFLMPQRKKHIPLLLPSRCRTRNTFWYFKTYNYCNKHRGILFLPFGRESILCFPLTYIYTHDREETLHSFRRNGYSTDLLFDFSIATDVKNSSFRAIYFDQALLGMSREYLVKGKGDEDVGHYFDFMQKVYWLYANW